jgi:hypothetical protein
LRSIEKVCERSLAESTFSLSAQLASNNRAFYLFPSTKEEELANYLLIKARASVR